MFKPEGLFTTAKFDAKRRTKISVVLYFS